MKSNITTALLVFTFVAPAATAQSFAECQSAAQLLDPPRNEINYKVHGQGYLSYENHKQIGSITEVIYEVVDCATGDTLMVDFQLSHRKKTIVNGKNLMAIAANIRGKVSTFVPSWGNEIERLQVELSEADIESRFVAEVPMTCACRTAYPDINR